MGASQIECPIHKDWQKQGDASVLYANLGYTTLIDILMERVSFASDFVKFTTLHWAAEKNDPSFQTKVIIINAVLKANGFFNLGLAGLDNVIIMWSEHMQSLLCVVEFW